MSKNNEIEELEIDEELFTLESLITEGADLQIPITFNYPSKQGLKKVSAIIRPVTSAEWEEATNYALKNKRDFTLKILEKGFLDDNGESIPIELLKLMPAGVVNELYRRIADISGVKENKKEQFALTKELMGF